MANRRLIVFPTIVIALVLFLVVALVVLILSEIRFSGEFQWSSVRMNWSWCRFGDLPCIYDPEYFGALPGVSVIDHVLLNESLLANTVILTVVMILLHSAIYMICAALVKFLGWPPYWAVVRDRLSLNGLWGRSASMFACAFFLYFLTWNAIDWFGTGEIYCWTRFITRDWIVALCFLLATLIAIGMLYARSLRKAVIGAIQPSETLCRKCGYALRGLDGGRCPECGGFFAPQDPIEFGILRIISRPGRRLLRRVFIAILLILWSTPVTLPAVVKLLPSKHRQTLTWLGHFVSAPVVSPISYPIRLDCICLIQGEGQQMAIRFHRRGHRTAGYSWASWLEFPNQGLQVYSGTGEISLYASSKLDFGRTELVYSVAIAGKAIWLSLPDRSYSIQAWMPDDAPAELLKLLPDEDTSPSQSSNR